MLTFLSSWNWFDWLLKISLCALSRAYTFVRDCMILTCSQIFNCVQSLSVTAFEIHVYGNSFILIRDGGWLGCWSRWFIAYSIISNMFVSQCFKFSVSAHAEQRNITYHLKPLSQLSTTDLGVNWFTLHKSRCAQQILRKLYQLTVSFLFKLKSYINTIKAGYMHGFLWTGFIWTLWWRVRAPLRYCRKCHYEFWRGSGKHFERRQALYVIFSPFYWRTSIKKGKVFARKRRNIWPCSDEKLSKAEFQMTSLTSIFKTLCVAYHAKQA